MGQKVSVNVIRTDSRIKPGSLQLGKEGSLPVQLGNGKDDDDDDEDEEEEEEEDEEDEENKCPCECCVKKCPCCVKLTFCCLAAFA